MSTDNPFAERPTVWSARRPEPPTAQLLRARAAEHQTLADLDADTPTPGRMSGVRFADLSSVKHRAARQPFSRLSAPLEERLEMERRIRAKKALDESRTA